MRDGRGAVAGEREHLLPGHRQLHRPARRRARAASAAAITWACGTPLLPKPPPTYGATTRTWSGSRPSTGASVARDARARPGWSRRGSASRAVLPAHRRRSRAAPSGCCARGPVGRSARPPRRPRASAASTSPSLGVGLHRRVDRVRRVGRGRPRAARPRAAPRRYLDRAPARRPRGPPRASRRARAPTIWPRKRDPRRPAGSRARGRRRSREPRARSCGRAPRPRRGAPGRLAASIAVTRPLATVDCTSHTCSGS